MDSGPVYIAIDLKSFYPSLKSCGIYLKYISPEDMHVYSIEGEPSCTAPRQPTRRIQR